MKDTEDGVDGAGDAVLEDAVEDGTESVKLTRFGPTGARGAEAMVRGAGIRTGLVRQARQGTPQLPVFRAL
jgi:hypothetical protein